MSSALISEKRDCETMEEERERLLTRKKKLENRLLEINGPPMGNKNEWKIKKTEVHWDSLLQELVCIRMKLRLPSIQSIDLAF
jgi:hypothetical protein